MIRLVTTETGSVYKLDDVAKTWERIAETERSGNIRTQGGEYYEVFDIEVGKRGFIEGPGLAFGNRWIHTTIIVSIETRIKDAND
jgi:hypothetical protein